MSTIYKVTQVSPNGNDTVLHVGSTVQIEANDVRVNGSKLWSTIPRSTPSCSQFDVVGIARTNGNTPITWFSITKSDDGSGLQGAFYGTNPCSQSVPSATATWEADEENVDPDPIVLAEVNRYVVRRLDSPVRRLFRRTLHRESVLTITDGVVTCDDRRWKTFPPDQTCSAFDYVGTVRVGWFRLPFSISVHDSRLEGAFYISDPCRPGVPSAIATWEADEENIATRPDENVDDIIPDVPIVKLPPIDQTPVATWEADEETTAL